MIRNPASVPSEDDLDGLLRAFFQAQMPAPWPKPPSPPLSLRPRRTPPSRRALFRSRAALAASVALLILGSFWLAGRSGSPSLLEPLPDLQYPHARNSSPLHRSSAKTHLPAAQPAAPEPEPEGLRLLDPMDLPPMK